MFRCHLYSRCLYRNKIIIFLQVIFLSSLFATQAHTKECSSSELFKYFNYFLQPPSNEMRLLAQSDILPRWKGPFRVIEIGGHAKHKEIFFNVTKYMNNLIGGYANTQIDENNPFKDVRVFFFFVDDPKKEALSPTGLKEFLTYVYATPELYKQVTDELSAETPCYARAIRNEGPMQVAYVIANTRLADDKFEYCINSAYLHVLGFRGNNVDIPSILSNADSMTELDAQALHFFYSYKAGEEISYLDFLKDVKSSACN